MHRMSEDSKPDVDTSRPSEATQLRTTIEGHRQGLAICGISGPGGIGKSYLIDNVLSSLDITQSGWMALRVDAAHAEVRDDFFALIDGEIARRSLAPPADASMDYFPNTRRVAAKQRAIVTRVEAELNARDDVSEEVKQAVVAMLKSARFLNQTVSYSQKFLDLTKYDIEPDKVGEFMDETLAVVKTLKTLRDSELMPDAVRDWLGMNLESRLKRDPYGVTTEALVSDLSAVLTDETTPHSSLRELLRSPSSRERIRISGLDRLLLVIDDYEALEATLREFLISSLIPRLADARFATLLIIAGRDDLEATNPGWGQHCKRYLADPIRLRSFDEETAAQLMEAAGIPEARRARIFELTKGFPLMLSFAIEEATTGEGGSALFLKKVFDRTTRWMTADQRDWFVYTCYLDEVNEDSLRLFIPEEDIERVQDWFESEASIRDPTSATFRVLPLLREKVIRYIEVRSPARDRELRNRAQAGNGTPSP